jgi:uncharacterized protein
MKTFKTEAAAFWPALLVTLLPLLFATACSSAQRNAPDIASAILAEVNRVPAIDNHAHPVRFTGSGEPDREFDALPVDNMEPMSDPLQLRANDPGVLTAWQALWGYPYNDTERGHIAEWSKQKQTAGSQKSDGYPAWILDKAGIDIMLANRVRMGGGIQSPRFRWVPYADALLFPLDNSQLAAANSDRKAFFADEDAVRSRYLRDAGLDSPPKTLDEYLRVVVTTLERQKQGGAVAEKFEVAYLRSFGFEKTDAAAAARVYADFAGKGAPPGDQYRTLQDFLFRFIAAECGRLGMAVHLHSSAGAGSYFDVHGANPLLLEPVFNDPGLRKTKFVMVHGGWPFNREAAALLTKPNVYLDYSAQSLLFTPRTLAQSLREWMEYVPEKVLFGTDAYPYSQELGWEESLWIAAKRGREALGIALTGMVRDRQISESRALELARMVLRENARALYGF